MSESTRIEWTDHTWSPWEGCQKAGPGCDRCYAEARNKRFAGGANWGPGAPRRKTADWSKPYAFDRAAARDGVRRRTFPSLCDPFDNAVDPLWRAEHFLMMANTRHLDHLLLTKRIGNAEAMITEAIETIRADLPAVPAWPWPNVWIGATVVNQEEADRDIPKLLGVAARVRFLSIEPMLGPITIDQRLIAPIVGTSQHGQRFIDWVICGGESGHGARPMHPGWARSLRDQCAAAGVPFLFKQWGEWLPEGQRGPLTLSSPTKNVVLARHFEDGQRTYLDGKKAAGRLLDGVEHNEFPVARQEVATP